MFFRKKLKEEIIRLTYRVAELEERLCPCEQHDYVETSHKFVMGTSPMDIETLRTYKCRRCGKVVRKYDWE